MPKRVLIKRQEEREIERGVRYIWIQATYLDSEFDPCEIFHYGPDTPIEMTFLIVYLLENKD